MKNLKNNSQRSSIYLLRFFCKILVLLLVIFYVRQLTIDNSLSFNILKTACIHCFYRRAENKFILCFLYKYSYDVIKQIHFYLTFVPKIQAGTTIIYSYLNGHCPFNSPMSFPFDRNTQYISILISQNINKNKAIASKQSLLISIIVFYCSIIWTNSLHKNMQQT